MLELVRQAVAQYELRPADVFSNAELEAAVLKRIVDDSIPYCDRNGNTWSGVGRRPAWLSEAIQAGAAFGGMLDQRLGHLAGSQQHHFTAQAFGQLLGILQA